jgi:hypothetical protein
MAKISTYSVVSPKGADKIIISDADGSPSNATKNVTVEGLQTFINDVPAPTLQEVTTSGNTTNKTITTQGIKSEGTRDADLVVKVGDYDGSLNKTKLEVDVANKKVTVNSDILSLNKLEGNRTEITFNPTATRSIAIPNASGTIALTSDLPSATPWNPDTNGINYQAGNVGIGTSSTSGDALTVDGQIKSTSIETGSILVEGNATIDDALSAGTVTAGSVTASSATVTGTVAATTLTGNLVGTVDTTTTGITQPSTTDNNLLATTAFVQDLLGDIVTGLQFQELWNATTDIPDLSTATPSNGDFWIVEVAGNTNLSGITSWAVGDWAIYIVPAGGGAAFWQKVDNTTSIAGNGTGNQVAKWSGVGASTTLTNSIITSTATAVGINVLAPTSALEVSGEIVGTLLDIQSNALIQGNLQVDQNITVDGNVGINVNNPTSALEVNGEIKGTSLDIDGGALIQANLNVDQDLNVDGVTTLGSVTASGTLGVTGNATFGNVDIQNTLTVGNPATFSSEVITPELQVDKILIEIPGNTIKVKNPGVADQLEITGESGVDVVSGDGLTLEVSDVFDFRGSAGINVFNGNVLSASLDVSQITTSRNFLFPDNNGTIALLSDITPTTGPSEWVGQLGVDVFSGVPVIATSQTSTLFVGDRVTTPTAFRDITFSRNAVGTYRLAVNWTQSTVPTDATKLAVMFGDNVARVYTFTLGSIAGVNYKEFLFRTYTPAGVEADDQLLGINGAMTSVILY